MNSRTRTLRRFSITALLCLGGIAISASVAHAGKQSCDKHGHDHSDHDRRADRDHEIRYGDDYDRRTRNPVATPVRFEPRQQAAARQCRQASVAQRQIFTQRLAQLDQTEARTVRDAYMPRTRNQAQRVAADARAQARRLTTEQRRNPWRSRALACRDDVRRFRAATQTVDRSIDRLMRLAARDARRARRFAPRQGPVYTAPRGPARRAPNNRPVRVVYR